MSEALLEKQIINEHLVGVDDTSTWLAEVLDGSMRTEFCYQYNSEDLIARDGRPLSVVFNSAIEDAEELSVSNPELEFELRRRRVEYGEFEDMIAMAKGDLPNTMVVVSDHPKELWDSAVDKLGYNVSRHKTMLRVISRLPDGTIKCVSQSLDGSDRTSLESLYDYLGAPVADGELLGQRIHVEMDEINQEILVDNLMNRYDKALGLKFGGDWRAGRRSLDRRNTMVFAEAQVDLLDTYLAGPQDEEAKYNLAAAISARFENKANISLMPDVGVGYINYDSPTQEMEAQGRLAMLEGKTFSGCGGTLTREMSAEEELSQLGYGDSDKKDSGNKMRCVNCPGCGTFHHEVREIKGRPVCDNEECKLSDRYGKSEDSSSKSTGRIDLLQLVLAK